MHSLPRAESCWQQSLPDSGGRVLNPWTMYHSLTHSCMCVHTHTHAHVVAQVLYDIVVRHQFLLSLFLSLLYALWFFLECQDTFLSLVLTGYLNKGLCPQRPAGGPSLGGFSRPAYLFTPLLQSLQAHLSYQNPASAFSKLLD